VGRWVLHVDLDQFIAAVEVLRRPELRGLPVVVGGDGDPTKRGVVATASYEAREYRVHSGVPLRVAARRCPQAVFLPVDKPAYETVSAEVMTTLREFDAVVEVVGWDEAFLGVVTDDPGAVAGRIQERVRSATQLECSVGIGQNKLQAKLATGFGKPAGIGRLTHATWSVVMGERPTDALWGIGAKTAARLAGLGIRTVAELAATDPDRLAAEIGPTIGPWLVRLGRGQDTSSVVGDPWVPRSRGREITFQQDLDDWEQVRIEVARLAGQVAADVSVEGRDAVRVGIKIRWVPFVTQTHGHALPEPTRDPQVIQRAALAALEFFAAPDDGTAGVGGGGGEPGARPRRVRLLGVRTELAP
jgi:nucleotidyltransferase/DNA polymerase involved in DNA repair